MNDALDVFRPGRQVESLGQGRGGRHRDHHLGSSPRPVGSQLGVDDSGAMVGSVSGGCIEGAVVQGGLASIADGKPRLLDFGVTDEQAWDVGLACGGKVQVFVEKVTDEGRNPCCAAGRAHQSPCAGARHATERCRGDPGLSGQGRSALANDQALVAAARRALGIGRSETVDVGGQKIFLNVYVPPPRLIIVGAVHIAQALAPMATMLDFDVTVVDPRGAWATGSRFPGVKVVQEWPTRLSRRWARRLDRRGDPDARSQARRTPRSRRH